MNTTYLEPVNQTQASVPAAPVSDIQLSPRQSEFLRRVRKHDSSVKVFALGEQLYFRGVSISGLMPSETTHTNESEEDSGEPTGNFAGPNRDHETRTASGQPEIKTAESDLRDSPVELDE